MRGKGATRDVSAIMVCDDPRNSEAGPWREVLCGGESAGSRKPGEWRCHSDWESCGRGEGLATSATRLSLRCDQATSWITYCIIMVMRVSRY